MNVDVQVLSGRGWPHRSRVQRTQFEQSVDDEAARLEERRENVQGIEFGSRFTKSLTRVEVLPILTSSGLADPMAASYALANCSTRSGGTGPGRTTKPRSCNTAAASIGSSRPEANTLNQSDILID